MSIIVAEGERAPPNLERALQLQAALADVGAREHCGGE